MNLTITQQDNEEALASDLSIGDHIVSHCPTAIAYAKAKGMPIGSVLVGYSDTKGSIVADGGTTFLATFKGELLDKVQAFTRGWPNRPPILGTFKIEEK